MKTHLIFPAFCLLLLTAACKKDVPVLPIYSNDPPDTSITERCGCLPPVSFDVQNVTDVSAHISWNAMPEASGYQIEVISAGYETPGSTSANVHIIATTDDNHITLSGLLVPNTRYKFSVTTVCRIMNSEPSASVQFETKSPRMEEPWLPELEGEQSQSSM